MRAFGQRLQHRDFNGDGRTDGLRPTMRSYKSLLVKCIPAKGDLRKIYGIGGLDTPHS